MLARILFVFSLALNSAVLAEEHTEKSAPNKDSIDSIRQQLDYDRQAAIEAAERLAKSCAADNEKAPPVPKAQPQPTPASSDVGKNQGSGPLQTGENVGRAAVTPTPKPVDTTDQFKKSVGVTMAKAIVVKEKGKTDKDQRKILKNYIEASRALVDALDKDADMKKLFDSVK